MKPVDAGPELSTLLARYEEMGGVLDFVLLSIDEEAAPADLHRAAVLAGITEIDRRLERIVLVKASEEFPAERFFRLRWDESLLRGEQIEARVFWGTEDVVPVRLNERVVAIPDIDGYRTAFLHPPYGLRGSFEEQASLFERMNRLLFGSGVERCEIFSWSTDWSNYFDAGKEWWGAFCWTIRPAGSDRLVVIGASATD